MRKRNMTMVMMVRMLLRRKRNQENNMNDFLHIFQNPNYSCDNAINHNNKSNR